jgi:hypothetical protein
MAHAKSGSAENIGFFLAMDGDFETEHKPYTPVEPPSTELSHGVVASEAAAKEEEEEDPALRDCKRARHC